MIFHRKPLLSGLFLLCAGCAPLLAAQPFTFASFDFPGAAATTLWGINNRGDVVGSYENPANYFHGFVYRDGQFTSIDGPGAAFTEIRGIDDAGDIVGTFITLDAFLANAPGGGFQGLFQKHGGDLTTMNVPAHLNTMLQRIKHSGLIYGCYHDDGMFDGPRESMHGIVTHAATLPQGSFDAMPDGTTMNVGGDAKGSRFAGQWYDFAVSRHRGYLVENGRRLDFDAPGSNLTTAWDMDAAGDVVGVWGDPDGHPDPEATSTGAYHGFLRDFQGAFTSLDFPAAIDTKAYGINNLGYVVGSYINADGNRHGFIARKGLSASK